MEIISLKCNNCGANLEVNPKVKFFNCTFCKNSLTIKKTGNVMFTEALDEIKDDTETLINYSKVILFEKEVDRMDREWLIERQKYEAYDKDRERSARKTNSENGSWGWNSLGMVIILGVIGGEIIAIIALVVVYLFRILIIVKSGPSSKERKYATARNRYEQARRKLIAKINKKKQSI